MEDAGPSASSSGAERVRGPLGNLLHQFMQQPAIQDSWGVPSAPHTLLDWDAPEMMDVDTELHASVDARNLAFLAARMEEFMNEQASDIDSDDEDVERSDAESSASSEDCKLFLARILWVFNEYPVPRAPTRKSRKVNLDAPNTDWFPWPDREVDVPALCLDLRLIQR
jgi:hypothetical protein